MADNSKVVSNLTHVAVLSSGDTALVCLANGAVRLAPPSTAYSNVNVVTSMGRLVLANNSATPANSVISVLPGEVWCDGNYLYIGTGPYTVKRVALESF